jgi:hypothetical protein
LFRYDLDLLVFSTRMMNVTAPDEASQWRASKYNSENVAPPQTPFNRMRHHRTRGDARIVGARRAPKKHALSRKNPESNNKAGEKNAKSKKPGDAALAGTLPVTEGKILQNLRITPTGYPCFHPASPGVANPG